MKKLISTALVLTLIFSLSSCDSISVPTVDSAPSVAEKSADDETSKETSESTVRESIEESDKINEAESGEAQESEAAAETTVKTVDGFTGKTLPFYFGGEKWNEEVSLYFKDDAQDLPYIEVNDCINLLKKVYNDTVDFSISREGKVVTVSRYNKLYDTDVPLIIDFDRDTMHFADYNLFVMRVSQSTMLDMTSIDTVNAEGECSLIQKTNIDSVFDRRGDALEIDLGAYDIDLIESEGSYFIPLQTVSDILIAPTWLESLYFNGQCVIMADDITQYSDLYYAAPTGERSEALTKFGYGELCMMLDNLYGLKENHRIDSFDKLFNEVGFKDKLIGGSVEDADKAIYRLISDYIDDIHSKWFGFSYLSGQIDYTADSVSKNRMLKAIELYRGERANVYPEGIPGYEEVGNTAYITFDEFIYPKPADEYYEAKDSAEFSDKDTVGLIMKAHDQITRENSPIENVVIDLSTNIGGSADAAEFVIAWFLQEGSIGMRDTMTGAMCNSTYRADVNRDRKFDDKDTLGDRKLFCLISPISFSCGNLVPCMFKESGFVTLLGRNSGGGACVTQPISSAWGTSFRISSPRQLSFMKNGSFYDIDRGTEPDFVLTGPKSYYDREALTEYINSLP